MYDRIAREMNEHNGSSDMDAGLVEKYLRYGDDALLGANETLQIDILLDKFL